MMGKCFLLAGCLFVGMGAIAADQKDQTSSKGDVAAIEEIVVTAQRREESLQRVPIAISALTSTELKNANITSGVDLGKVVPSLQLHLEAGTVTTTLRGVGSAATPIGNEASVALYIDGIYYPRLAPVMFLLNNIDRVEVLKGPQGTLFGRNSSGGLINVVTRSPKPGQETVFEASMGYGNFDTTDISLYAAGSFSSRLSADFSFVQHNQRDGWGKNLYNGSQNDTNFQEAARSKWVFSLSDETRAIATFEYTRARTDIGLPNHYYSHLQGYYDGSGSLPVLGIYDVNNNQENYTSSRGYGGAFRLEHDFAFATLINTFSAHHLEQRYFLDLDASPQDALNVTLPSYSKDYIDELQLVSNKQSSVDWIVGFYAMKSQQAYTPNGLTGYAIGPGVTAQTFSHEQTKSYSGYLQGTYEILPKTRLTLGARYTKDDLDGGGYSGVILPGSPFLLTPGSETSGNASFSKVTWKAALDYQFKDNVMVFFSASRGFKGGVFNMVPFNPVPAKPEIVDAYELGVKTDLWDRRIRFNASVYDYEIKNPQVLLVQSAAVAYISNAGKSRNQGIDLDFTAALTSNLSAHASANLLRAIYIDYKGAPAFTVNPAIPFGDNGPFSVDASGTPAVRSPKYTVNLGLNYKVPLAAEHALDFGINLAETTKFYWDPDHRNYQASYGLLDAQVTYSWPSDRAKLKFWGANLANKEYYVSENPIAGPTGDIASPGAPRTWGVNLSYKF